MVEGDLWEQLKCSNYVLSVACIRLASVEIMQYTKQQTKSPLTHNEM